MSNVLVENLCDELTSKLVNYLEKNYLFYDKQTEYNEITGERFDKLTEKQISDIVREHCKEWTGYDVAELISKDIYMGSMLKLALNINVGDKKHSKFMYIFP